ncbi:unnamed protein product, partial [Symbiodinium pilosum]
MDHATQEDVNEESRKAKTGHTVVLQKLGEELEVAEDEIQRLRVVSAELSAEQRRELWPQALQQLCDKSGASKFKEKVRQLLKGPPPGNVRITVGPVIGKVTESSARILVEASHDVERF